VLHGEPGSGKTYLADRLARRSDALTLRVANVTSGRLMLATLAQSLLPVSDAECAEALGRVLLHPSSLEEDVVKVGVALSRLRRSVLVIFDHAHHAPPEVTPLIEFLLRMPAETQRVFLLLSRELPAQAGLTRTLLRSLERAHCLELALPPLTQPSIQRALESEFPFEPSKRLQMHATRLLQSSEGNPMRLLSLLEQSGDLRSVGVAHIPPAVRERYDAEIETWPTDLGELMSALSVIAGQFDRTLARVLLTSRDPDAVDALIDDALTRRLLTVVEPDRALRWPDLGPEPHGRPHGEEPAEGQLMFVNEGLRVTLSGRLSQRARQQIRARLAETLASRTPGIASYYADRAGLRDRAEAMRQAYRASLPAGSPLLDPRPTPGGRTTRTAAPEPTPGRSAARPSVSHQGYLVTPEEGAWLSVRSEGRFGHPRTLRLRFALPVVNDPDAELCVVWRLDVYGEGRELAPSRSGFALRLHAADAPTAHVLTPQPTLSYHEDGLAHDVCDDADLGYWMEHRFKLSEAERQSRTLELDVRALDVALTVASLRWGGTDVLVGTTGSTVTDRASGAEAARPDRTVRPVGLSPAPLTERLN